MCTVLTENFDNMGLILRDTCLLILCDLFLLTIFTFLLRFGNACWKCNWPLRRSCAEKFELLPTQQTAYCDLNLTYISAVLVQIISWPVKRWNKNEECSASLFSSNNIFWYERIWFKKLSLPSQKKWKNPIKNHNYFTSSLFMENDAHVGKLSALPNLFLG